MGVFDDEFDGDPDSDPLEDTMSGSEDHGIQSDHRSEPVVLEPWQQLVLLRAMGRLLKAQRHLNPTLRQIAPNSDVEDAAFDALERYKFGRRRTDHMYDAALEETSSSTSIH
jgi:hypothetical protein